MRHTFRPASALFILVCFTAGTFAQSGLPASNPSDVTPETAFVSSSKYTNAFFGFSLTLPRDAPLRGLSIPSRDVSHHFLFGVQALRNGLTALTIMANNSTSASAAEEARKAAAGPKGQGTKRIEIGGREFWKSESQEKSRAGKMRNITFATSLNGYVLEFHIMSFDAKLTEELQHSIESISFFDPVRAREMAGLDSRPYNPAAEAGSVAPVPSSDRIGRLDPGTLTGNIYTNNDLGFSYQFPSGWVVADKATQEKVVEAGHQAAWGDSPAASREHERTQQCTRILLWVNQYQTGTKTEELNPLIAIMALDPACTPGAQFPTSADDSNRIKQLVQQVERSFAGTPFLVQGQNSVRTFTVHGRLVVEISSASTVSVAGRKAPLDTFTSLTFTVAKDYWVAWMLMGGNQAGLEDLRKNKITFNSSAPAAQ